MPEIVECYTMAKQLNEKFKDKILHNLDFVKKPGKKTKNCAYESREELSKLLPKKVINIFNKGKKIIVHLEDDVFIIFSPLMTGSFIYKEGNHTFAKLIFEEHKEAFFNDVQGQALINLYTDQKSFEEKMSEIGPDWINSNITLEDFKSKITNKRIKNQQIVQFLMDQKRFSGVGNYLKAEILYDCKMYPGKQLFNLTETDITDLYNSIKKIIDLALKGNGLTIKDYITPDGEVGTFETKIYKKENDPLGNPVIKEEFKDSRTTSWVREVQK